jgi:hypothetical protein
MSCKIYGMVNPANRMIFYVGITNNLRIREKQHKILTYATAPMKEILCAINYTGFNPEFVVLKTEQEGERLSFSDEMDLIHVLLEFKNYLVNRNNVPQEYRNIALLAAEFHAKACYAYKLKKGLVKESDSLESVKMKAGLPAKYGKMWSEEEKSDLWLRFEAGDSISKIAQDFQRSSEQVIKQLDRISYALGTNADKKRLADEAQSQKFPTTE